MGWARVNFKPPKTPDLATIRNSGGFWGFFRLVFSQLLKTPKTPEITDSKGFGGFLGFSQNSS